MRGQPATSRELRRERMAGNWGGASEHIGRQWEEMGLRMLQNRLDVQLPWPVKGYIPRQLVALAGDEALQLALSRSGLPSPDVVVMLEGSGGRPTLQALDFKWNLEFASYGQICSEALTALLQRAVAPLDALLQQTLGLDPRDLPVLDGLLAAPDLPVNRWFLTSDRNLRQEYPIESREVIFETVSPMEFFGPLPGWGLATLLAQTDRSTTRLQTLEGAEHYYRVGTGLLGAVTQLQVSIFVRHPAPVDAKTAFDWLRSRIRPHASIGFLQHSEKLMAARSQLLSRLRALSRSPYRFSNLTETLKGLGIVLPEKEDGLPSQERERWGEMLRRVATEHKELVYRTGLRLVQSGLTDAETLSRMESDYRRFADRARAHAEKLIAASLAAQG